MTEASDINPYDTFSVQQEIERLIASRAEVVAAVAAIESAVDEHGEPISSVEKIARMNLLHHDTTQAYREMVRASSEPDSTTRGREDPVIALRYNYVRASRDLLLDAHSKPDKDAGYDRFQDVLRERSGASVPKPPAPGAPPSGIGTSSA